MEELSRQEQTRPLYSQIVAQRDRTALAAESFLALLLLLAIVSAVLWWQSVNESMPPWLAMWGVPIGGLIVVWLAVVWLPAVVAGIWADPLVLRTWEFWKGVSILLAPSVWAAEGLSRLLRRLAGRPLQQATEESLEEEILTIVNEGQREGLLEEDAREMIEGVIELGDATVAQIMTPRTDVASVHVGLEWTKSCGPSATWGTPACRSITKAPTTSSASCTPRTSWPSWRKPTRRSAALGLKFSASRFSSPRPSRLTNCCKSFSGTTSIWRSCWTNSAACRDW